MSAGRGDWRGCAPARRCRHPRHASERTACAAHPNRVELRRAQAGTRRETSCRSSGRAQAYSGSASGCCRHPRDGGRRSLQSSNDNKCNDGSSSDHSSSGSIIATDAWEEARRTHGRGTQGAANGYLHRRLVHPQPWPGGWGIVAVRDGKVLWSDRGEERETTNNRMELSAIVFALRRIGEDEGGIIYTDSNLCVRTLTEWAPRWERNNWTRAQGEQIKNLDLVQEALTLARARPGVEFKWLRAHAGSTWNEYADILAGGRQ